MYSRYMLALSYQYKGFELMLDECSSKFYSDTVEYENNTLILKDARLSTVTEAYEFAPLRYWESIGFNIGYPIDITSSVNSDTAFKITPGTIDGVYNYYFCIDDNWYKNTIQIENGKIISYNNISITDETKLYNTSERIITLLEVNPRYDANLETTLIVRQEEASEIKTDLAVSITKTKQIKTSIFVMNVSEISTELYVWGHSEIPITMDIWGLGVTNIDTALIVSIVEDSILPTNIVVKRTEHNDIDTNIFVYRKCDIQTDLVVVQKGISDVETVFTVGRWEFLKGIPIEILVKRSGEDSPKLPVHIYVIRYEHSDLGMTAIIAEPRYSNVTTTLDIPRYDNVYNTETTVTVYRNQDNKIPAYLFINNSDTVMESIASIDKNQKSNSSNLLASMYVAAKHIDDICTTVFVKRDTVLETIHSTTSISNSNLDTNIVVIDKDEDLLFTYIFVETEIRLESIANYIHARVTEIPVILTVSNIVSENLDTSIVVARTPELQSIANIGLHRNYSRDELNTFIDVSHDNTKELLTMLVVGTESIQLQARVKEFAISGKSRIPTYIAVSNNDTYMIPTTILVSDNHAMMLSTANIKLGSTSSIETTLTVVFKESVDIPIYININPQGMMEAIVNEISYVYDDLETTLLIYDNKSLPVYVYVSNDKAVLESKAKTIPLKFKRKRLLADKDTYNYNFTPLTNYGLRQNLNLSYTAKNDVISTIVGFDYSELGIDLKGASIFFDYQVIAKATLYLYKTYSSEMATVKVYSTTDTWSEIGMCYKRAQDLNETYLTEIVPSIKNGWMTIDITADLQNFEELDSLLRSYILKIEKQQRENGIMSFASLQNNDEKIRPYVDIIYRDTNGNCSWIDVDTTLEVTPYSSLDTEIFVNNTCTDDIPVRIVVNPVDDNSDLETTVDVTDSIIFNDIETELFIIFYPCDERGPEINIYIPAKKAISTLQTEMIVIRDATREASVFIM